MTRGLLFSKRDADPNTLENWLASDKPEKRGLADEVLARMGESAALDFLLVTFERKEKTRKRRGIAWAFIVFVSALFLQVGIDMIGRKLGWRHPLSVSGFFSYFCLIGIVGVPPTRLQKECVRRILRLNQRRTIPCLIDIVDHSYEMERELAAKALTQHLPTLTMEELAALSDKQSNVLLALARMESKGKLSLETRHALACALIVMFTNLEHSDALKSIKKAAKRKVKTPEDQILQQTAISCLPLLERAAKEQNLVAVRR